MNDELKKVFTEYIENSKGVDKYAKKLLYSMDNRIQELEKQNKELIDFILHLSVNYDMVYGLYDIATKKQLKKLLKKRN